MKKKIKQIFHFLFIFIIVIGCGKNEDDSAGGGKLIVNMTYKSNVNYSGAPQSNKANVVNLDDARYTQFGNYITSITPSVYVIKFLEMRFLNYDLNGQTPNKGIGIIHSNMLSTDSARFADFTGNRTVVVKPNTDKYDSRESVEFNIFVFSTMFIYQEFQLPERYADVSDLTNLKNEKDYLGIDYKTSIEIGNQREGLSVKGSETPFIKNKLFANDMPHSYVFGSTDSTYIWTSTGQNINDPLGQWGHIVRSNKYNSLTIPIIPSDKTLTLHATMTFNSNNLIQVYAGNDNIPYTSDDVFVYAPKYWERLSVNMSME